MYRAWAWRAVQCVTCTWWVEGGKGLDEEALTDCDCGGWVRAWACLETRRSRPLAHSWHHESRLELGIHEHLPDDQVNHVHHAHNHAFNHAHNHDVGHSDNHAYNHGHTCSKDQKVLQQKQQPLHESSNSSNSSLQTLKDEMAEVTAEMEALDTGEDSKNNPKSKQMSIGRKKFNMDPKKGIEYLIDHGLLKNTPDDIAQFLYKGEGLNKTAIGDYLGERNEFNQAVLDAFVCLHDFTDLILVQALRQFLWSFRLPGEAQKIDRMMERFAHRYCELNPSIFQHPDTCFVLSFAIIMLNTSLHNPAVKDKQTIEQFIAMNRGIDNGDDLPRELLESLYDSIKTEPFKIPEDDGNDLMHTFFNPDREGWLMKQGGRYKSWKRRWFILNDNCLYYFEYTTDKEPRGIIPLENIEVREVQDRNKPNCFELYATSTDFIKACKTDSEGKVVEGKHTVYRMSAATPDEKEEWIKCIRQSISHNPFYDMLAKRKKNIQKNSSR
ncbi:cytohesin-1 isoform X1 [Panulirus ornatus]|uniref:cytohesin-1 isoform X1 n=1 Tax=Panulirus ornatus TaxID=150431 RepID=UPI003A8757BD